MFLSNSTRGLLVCAAHARTSLSFCPHRRLECPLFKPLFGVLERCRTLKAETTIFTTVLDLQPTACLYTSYRTYRERTMAETTAVNQHKSHSRFYLSSNRVGLIREQSNESKTRDIIGLVGFEGFLQLAPCFPVALRPSRRHPARVLRVRARKEGD